MRFDEIENQIFNSKKENEKYKKKDLNFYKGLEKIALKNNTTFKELLTNNDFMQRRYFTKKIAFYDLFKKTLNMPGSIADFGIYKGDSLFTWLYLLEIFAPYDMNKKIYAFDHFKNYIESSPTKDNNIFYNSNNSKTLLGSSNFPNKKMIEELIDLHNQDSVMPGIKRVELIDGDISKIKNDFKKSKMGLRFSIMNVDINLYKPVKSVIENFYDLLLPGGVMMFSGYTAGLHTGEGNAIEEYFKEKKFKKLPYSSYPRAYFIK